MKPSAPRGVYGGMEAEEPMTCTRWRSELVSWLQSRWETAEGAATALPRELAEHAAHCASCAQRLAAAQVLAAGTSRRPLPPPGLAERIGRRLLELPREVAFRRSGWVRPAVRWGLLPVAAALAAAVGTAALFGAFTPRERAMAGLPAAGTVIVRFVLEAPQARQVALVGDWNQWDPRAQPLSDADGDGVWEAQIPLRRGQEHQYQFLIDGTVWVPDPHAALQVEDGLGGVNSVLQI